MIVAEFASPEPSFLPFVNRVRAIQHHFLSHGDEALIVTPGLPHETGREDPFRNGTSTVTVYETRRARFHSPFAITFLFADLVNYLRKIRAIRPDAILICGSSPFLLLESFICARLRRVPAVIDVHDSWLLMSVVHPGRIRNFVRQAIEGGVLRNADRVAGVTETLVRLLVGHYGVELVKTIVVQNGTSARPRSGSTRPDIEYDMIHAGPPRDYYDTDLLLDGLALLRTRRENLRVAFLGLDTPTLRQRWEAEARERGLLQSIILLPSVPYDKVDDVLVRARVGLVSIKNHWAYKAGISTKSFDYIAAGLPILCLGPRDSEQASMISRYQIGLCVESPEHLADAGERLLSDPSLRGSMSFNARVASAAYSWENVLAPLRLAIQSSVERRAG